MDLVDYLWDGVDLINALLDGADDLRGLRWDGHARDETLDSKISDDHDVHHVHNVMSNDLMHPNLKIKEDPMLEMKSKRKKIKWCKRRDASADWRSSLSQAKGTGLGTHGEDLWEYVTDLAFDYLDRLDRSQELNIHGNQPKYNKFG